MTGHSLRSLVEHSGYFHVWLAAAKRDSFFQDGLEKTFFLAQMQSLLTAGQGSHHSCNLLAYALTRSGAHLLFHTERKPLMECLVRTLTVRFAEYLTQRGHRPVLRFDALLITDQLAGVHEALNVSREIHLLPSEWRHARYSSIGFYLEGRSAPWLQPGRLTDLFDNDPAAYLRLLKSRRTESDRIFEFIET